MLPSASRLKKNSDFRRVYARGRSYATDLVVVYVAPSRDKCTRIGFSVGRKLGKAVARNRVKRVLREATRELLPSIPSGYDIIVIARTAATAASFWDLRSALVGALRQSKITKGAE